MPAAIITWPDRINALATAFARRRDLLRFVCRNKIGQAIRRCMQVT